MQDDGTQDLMRVAFAALRDAILDRLDKRLSEEMPDTSAVADQHAVGFMSGFKRGINTAREDIAAMKRGEF